MDILESLETLNVSEECFNDIIVLVETLVGKFAEKGAPVVGNEEEFKKGMIPLVRVKKELAKRKTQSSVKDSEKLKGDIEDAQKEIDKAKQEYDNISKEQDAAYKAYKETDDGTDLNTKSFSKWKELLDKETAAGQKHSDAWDKHQELRDLRDKVISKTDKNERTLNNRGDLLARITGNRGPHFRNLLGNNKRTQASDRVRKNLYPQR